MIPGSMPAESEALSSSANLQTVRDMALQLTTKRWSYCRATLTGCKETVFNDTRTWQRIWVGKWVSSCDSNSEVSRRHRREISNFLYYHGPAIISKILRLCWKNLSESYAPCSFFAITSLIHGNTWLLVRMVHHDYFLANYDAFYSCIIGQ